jgi:hypothetical protein
MISYHHSGGVRLFAGTFAIVLGIFHSASSQAQTPQPTAYGICSYMVGNVAYVSNNLSLPSSQMSGAANAFRQYAMQTAGASNPRCSWAPTMQALTSSVSAIESKAGTAGAPAKFVNTGWNYQPTAVSTPAATQAAFPNTLTAAPATTANTTYNPGATTTQPNSMGSAISASGQNAKQSLESSATGTVTNSVNSMTNTATEMMNGGMTSLQNKLFHKKSAQAPAAPAAQPTTAAAPAAGATPAVAQTASVPASNLVASAPAAAAKPTIQDEGDGKHSILMLPGQSDAHELTLVSGSKNVYIEETTGDKYILMPSGEITHILHKNAAQ